MISVNSPEILFCDEMSKAEEITIRSGISSETLMENAGRAVSTEIRRRWAKRSVSILCGPGNNGGDGFVVARHLSEAGWPVRVGLLGPFDAIKADPRIHANRWEGEVEPLTPFLINDADLIVDAIFGAGLTRSIQDELARLFAMIIRRRIPCIAVDLPTGIDGNDGSIRGVALPADLTVTFFRPKVGHFLLPGRALSGEVVVSDIGISPHVFSEISPRAFANIPEMWKQDFPRPSFEDHKYTRGHALIAGGPTMTGAGRLAAAAARRIGAGIVTVAADPDALLEYRVDSPGLLTVPFKTIKEFSSLLNDKRITSVLVGSGGGVTSITRDVVLGVAKSGRSLVVDADGLSVFAENPEEFFEVSRNAKAVLTPHEGEFSRLFDLKGSKVERACNAAKMSNAVVVLKGSDTVISSPEGRSLINFNAPPSLATAGSGDILAGMILGLISQGMPPFEAACASVWLCGEIANKFGPGLIAEDIRDGIPASLSSLFKKN